MRAALHNPSLRDDDNLPCVPHGVEPMRDHDDRLAFRQRFHRLLQTVFVLGIDIRRRLVEDDDRRVLQDGTRNGNALALTARKARATVSDHSIVALGQRLDEVVAACFACSGDNFLVRCRRLAEADVVFYRIAEKIDVLEDDADLSHQRFERVVAHIMSADLDAAVRHIPEACDEMAERRLARAARTDDRRQGAFRNRQ